MREDGLTPPKFSESGESESYGHKLYTEVLEKHFSIDYDAKEVGMSVLACTRWILHFTEKNSRLSLREICCF